MKISLLCSIALLMAAPLTAQSEHDPVKSAMNLLEKSQVEAAAGNLEAAAELAAKAQALLQESKALKETESLEKELRLIEERVQLELVHGELVELEAAIDGMTQTIVIRNAEPQVQITADGLVMIEDADGSGRLVELAPIVDFALPAPGCEDCDDDCENCEVECEVECEIAFAECEEITECEEISECEEIVCEEGSEYQERVALQWAVDSPNEGAVQWVVDPQQEGALIALGYTGEGSDFTTRNHWYKDSSAPHAQQGGDLHMELQALHMELQALRMELQALRMSMGMVHGNMGQMGGMGHMGQSNFGHGQMGQMGGMMMAPMHNMQMPQMRDARLPQMRVRSMSLPQGQAHGMLAPKIERYQFLAPQGKLELLNDFEHQFVYDGQQIGVDELGQLGYIGDMGADMDFEFDIQGLHEGSYELHESHGEAHGHDTDAHGEWFMEGKQAPQVHTEMKVIINGETFEGEAAKKKLEELGLGDMEKQVRVRVTEGGKHPLPPVPPTPPVPAKPHSHEEL